MNPNVLMFFKELWQRLSIKSPVFFRIVQVFTASLTFAGYIPSMMQRWFGVDVPGHYITLCEDIAKIAMGVCGGSFLTVDPKPVAIMHDGDILKKTDEQKMPFTKMCDERAKQKLKDVPKVAEVVDIKKDEASFATPDDQKKDQ